MSTAIRTYTGLAITDLDEFLFGRCPQPLSVGHGLEIGSGTVRPEINFTLPPMSITAATMPAVLGERPSARGSTASRLPPTNCRRTSRRWSSR